MPYIPAIVAAASAAAVALLGALLTDVGPWYRALRKPSWQPPDWLFAPVWTTIFTLTAIAGVLAWNNTPDGPARSRLLLAFAVNGILNVLWSALFFARRRPDWALIEVVVFLVSIVALLWITQPVSSTAAALLLPYLLWVTFASWLNLTIVQLNRPFG